MADVHLLGNIRPRVVDDHTLPMSRERHAEPRVARRGRERLLQKRRAQREIDETGAGDLHTLANIGEGGRGHDGFGHLPWRALQRFRQTHRKIGLEVGPLGAAHHGDERGVLGAEGGGHGASQGRRQSGSRIVLCGHGRVVYGAMEMLLEELAATLPDARETVRIVMRLFAALLAGGIIGFQREVSGKAAGLRTHMLVCMGSALFVLAGIEMGMEQDAMSRVVQGLATGIGFLGAGAILKLEDSHEIKGLTTAAGIWMTAALGVTIGLGHLGSAAIGTLFAWIVLAVLIRLDRAVDGSANSA